MSADNWLISLLSGFQWYRKRKGGTWYCRQYISLFEYGNFLTGYHAVLGGLEWSQKEPGILEGVFSTIISTEIYLAP